MDVIRNKWGLKDKFIGVGIDRIDYTKGILERLKALGKLLCKYPHYRRKVVFFQLGEPSRTHIPKYKDLNKEVDCLVQRINEKY